MNNSNINNKNDAQITRMIDLTVPFCFKLLLTNVEFNEEVSV